jgi:hypothetical protein
MQIPGVHIETIHYPRRYTYVQIDRGCAIAQRLGRGKLVPRRTAQAMNDLDQLRVELRALMASWEVRVRDGARLLGRRPPAASGGGRTARPAGAR